MTTLDGPHQAISLELVPWYSRLLLDLYPKCINADQMRIAFTAAVATCSTTKHPELAWDLVQRLLSVLDPLFSSGNSPVQVHSQSQPHFYDLESSTARDVTRRELFLVLADQIQSLPVTLFSKWSALVEERINWEPTWGICRAVLETIQDHVLKKLSAEKKLIASKMDLDMNARSNITKKIPVENKSLDFDTKL